MPSVSVLLVLVIVIALVFDYINGFHDTANAIATVVSTRVLAPFAAILMSAGLNFVGAIVATRVAKTIASGILVHDHVPQTLVLAAVLGAIVWNLVTWKFGIPSSSSHALIGGLCGAGIVGGGIHAINWTGLWTKVILPLILSPVAGFVLGFILMGLIALFFAKKHAGRISANFRSLQVLSSAAMAFSHGQNDAQKSMGIITLALVSEGIVPTPDVPMWVMLACATAMALGTSAGGWRIIKTMGNRIIRLDPVNGFAAETSGAVVILTASHFGMPVSTTHCIAGSIFGVGSSKRLSAVRWQVAGHMVVAWVLTIPAAAMVSGICYAALQLLPK